MSLMIDAYKMSVSFFFFLINYKMSVNSKLM